MEETKEIYALFNLLDDPDKEVFVTVSDKIVSFGKLIIPNLENLWENTPDEEVQKRIELLIHRLHFRDLSNELRSWNQQPDKDLLTGTLLASRFQQPELNVAPIWQIVEKMRQNIWLELNNYLTSLETTNVISTILYNYYNLKGTETLYIDPNNFLVDKLLETKKGSAISIGILYLSICELLNIPIKVINIPNQFILGYFNEDGLRKDQIQFFIDPLGGQIYTIKDVEAYFKRSSLQLQPFYLLPMNHTQVIQYQLKELAKCFADVQHTSQQEELLQLSAILSA